jgi:UDP-N-acetylmuramoyl-tripeptide--D-alanyl-D-alanine ligase
MNKLFPYKLHLQIFQLSEYRSKRLLTWVFNHFFTRIIENKKALVLTEKARIIYLLSLLLSLITLAGLTLCLGIKGLITGIIFLTQSYIFIILAHAILLPFEIYKKNKIKSRLLKTLNNYPNLKIIGVAGSYGKTSVKEFLYQILKTKHQVLKTPESYNTILGIAKVLDLEMDLGYEYFICEMGAYRIGEIAEICKFVQPEFGILTGINKQHLNTFGSLENVVKGKFELINSLPSLGIAVANGDNKLIKENVKKQNLKITFYGFSEEKFSIKNVEQNSEGTKFLLILNGKTYNAKTKLVGSSNLQNILGASTMSFLLGLKPEEIVLAIENIKAVPHRLEIKKMDNLTIIDDAYNSNIDGFGEAIRLLKSFKEPKVLVTPGIVDLGKETIPIHEELGKTLQDIDYVILIGKSNRTEGLKLGFKNKKRIIELDSIKKLWTKLEELKLKKPVILIENDLPDNY